MNSKVVKEGSKIKMIEYNHPVNGIYWRIFRKDSFGGWWIFPGSEYWYSPHNKDFTDRTIADKWYDLYSGKTKIQEKVVREN